VEHIHAWSFVIQIFHSGQLSHEGDRNIFEVMTSTLSRGTLGSVASLLAASLYHFILDFYSEKDLTIFLSDSTET
jgi:hypothetical protein